MNARLIASHRYVSYAYSSVAARAGQVIEERQKLSKVQRHLSVSFTPTSVISLDFRIRPVPDSAKDEVGHATSQGPLCPILFGSAGLFRSPDIPL